MVSGIRCCPSNAQQEGGLASLLQVASFDAKGMLDAGAAEVVVKAMGATPSPCVGVALRDFGEVGEVS